MLRSALLLVVLAVAAPVQAQLTEVQPGARVRVRAPGMVAGQFVGTVLQRNGDTIRVGAPNALPVDLPLDRIASFEVSRGSSRMLGAGVGSLWGGGIGLVLGALTASGSGDYYYGEYDKAAYIGAMTVSGLTWGAGIGALVGKERWESFELRSRSTMTVVPSRGGLAVSIRF